MSDGLNELLQAPGINAVSGFDFSMNVNHQIWLRLPALEHDAGSVLQNIPDFPIQIQLRSRGSAEKPLVGEEFIGGTQGADTAASQMKR